MKHCPDFRLAALTIACFAANATLVISSASAQVPEATSGEARLRSDSLYFADLDASPYKNVEFRSVGPTIMSGRIVDLDVSPDDPTHFYVAYASGGVWKTTSNGTNFEPISDSRMVMTVGDIAVRWSDPEVVYVGTGENNSSRSSYSGTGIYRTEDGGDAWSYLGLAETQHIGRILIDPDNDDVLYVAAIGHLYSKNKDRGVYKSVDGGLTWRQTLFIDDSTGVIDLVMKPDDPSTLYATAWSRQRAAWDFKESGESSGIYRSDDAGESWELVSTPDSGFPTGWGVGRIGLAFAPSDPSVMYAVVDNQTVREEGLKDAPALTFDQIQAMDSSSFGKQVSKDDLAEYLKYYGFPDRYSADTVLTLIESGKVAPADLVSYIGDANRALYDSPVVGCEVYRSNDAGLTWSRTHDDRLDDTCYTYGYYFGQIWVAPDDPGRIYIAGLPLLKSGDGGKTWEDIGRENVHGDHHAMWLDPTRPRHIINGNDGGLNMSYDDGESWFKLNTPSVGQFYSVNVDHEDPYNVYGGLQDNGVWVGPSTYEANPGWEAEGQYPYERVLGGDGMMVQPDPRNSDIVYAGFQFGYYYRVDRADDSRTKIRPEHDLGEEPFRFNWLTPIHLSTHNPDILYLGSNMVHRSMDRGDHWTLISGDLTRGAREGDVPFGTITSLSESPLRFGLIYAGSDDGLIHVTRDGGASWQRIDASLPQNLWVSRIEPSQFAEGRVYVSLNGYRWDNLDPYLYRSDDYGSTWQKIGLDLPLGPINVVREDSDSEDVLYVGTDRGLFVSMDRGASFDPIGADMPGVPVHDLRIQPEAHDLVVGTHGRSIFVADVSYLQQLTPEIMAEPLFVFASDSTEYDEGWGDKPGNWSDPKEPEVTLTLWASSGGSGALIVHDSYGHEMATTEFSADRGLNEIEYDLSTSESALETFFKSKRSKTTGADAIQELDKDKEDALKARDNGKLYLQPGHYELEIKVSEQSETSSLIIYE